MACVTKRRGRYVVDFYDNNGKRRWKTLPEGTTKKKARESMRDIEDQVRRCIYLPDRKVPLFKKIAQDWLEYKKPNVRLSTWKMYQGHLKHHFEAVNDLKINRISTVKVEKFIIAKREADINITTLRKILVSFNQVMNYAVRHGYIDYNPVRDAERPKAQGEHAGEDEALQVLTLSEINAFLEVETDQKYQTLFRLAIFSGARQGELFGLKWTDIDWFNNQVRVQRTFNHGRWYKPKSKESNRKIDLGPATMAELKKWKMACPPNDLDLIFPNEAGGPINHGNMLRRHFYPALKMAGCSKIRFHDIRHTYASLLIDQGENIKYIQNQLGHASPVVTLSVYAHLMKSVNQESARRLENTILTTTGSKMVAETKKEVDT